MQQPETVDEAADPVSSGLARRFSPAARFALLLALLIFAAFPQVLAGMGTFVVRDFGFFAYPLAHYQRECFWHGELPLWNPYNHCGVPFLAQWNTMALYPPALLYLILPLPWSLNFFCLVHLFWAGLGMYFLARRWTGSELGASIAGMAFAFNGFSLNFLMWPSHVATYSWMPWVVLLAEAAWSKGGRYLVLAALVGTMQMLAGGPETILFTWLIASALWLARLFGVGRPDQAGEQRVDCPRLPMAWRFPAMVALVACLAAAQLLPFLDLASHSQREQGFADARWSMPSWGWANFLVPMVFGITGKQGLFFQYNQYWTSSYYLGIGVLLLVFVALSQTRGARMWLLMITAALGLILATGDQTAVSRWARQAVPQLSLMTYPVKYVTLVIFSGPLLAAYGIRVLEQRGNKSGRTLLIAALLLLGLIAGVLVWAWRSPFPTDDVHATVLNGLTRAALLVTIAMLLWWIFSRTPLGDGGGMNPVPSRAGLTIMAVLLLGLLWCDVWTHEPQQNPTVAPWVYTAGLARGKLAMNPQPQLGGSRAMLSPAAESKFRDLVMNDPKDNFLVKRLGYFADCNLLDAVPTVNGFFSLAPRECGELYSLLYVSRYPFSSALPELMGVSQISSGGDFTAWETRTNYLPLATAGQASVFLEDTNALGLLLSTNFNPAAFVLLPVEYKGLVMVTNAARASVILKSVRPERIELEVDAEGPAMVVLSQSYYHSWKVHVDGRPERLLRANFAFQAFQVEDGKHKVSVAYEDRAFRYGLMLSGLGLLVSVSIWLSGKAATKPTIRAR